MAAKAKTVKPLHERLADYLKTGGDGGGSGFTSAEQVACFAAFKMCLRHWNSALANDIEVHFGVEVRREFQKALSGVPRSERIGE